MTPINIIRCCGTIELSVHNLVARLLNKNPHLVFREPVPTANRLENFVGLGGPQPDNSPEQALDEARLFWINADGAVAGSVHAVSSHFGDPKSTRTRWTAFWETCSDTKMDASWMIEELQECCLTSECIECQLTDSGKVFPLQNSARGRYGLTGHSLNDKSQKFKICRYVRGGNPIAWRIEEVRTASVTE